MNNDNNNGYSGQVLGNVNNNLGNTQPMQPETLETLDTNSSAMPINNTMNSNMNNGINTVMDNNDNLNNQTFMQTPPVNNGTMQNQTTGTYTPPVTPEPAYTNPQTISPMPGFENSGAIGTTPPISLEPEKQPKKKEKNKTLFVIIVIVLLFGVGFGTYYVLKYTDLLTNKSKIEIDTKNIEINVGDVLSTNIRDYAIINGTDEKNCSLNTKDVNVSVEGTYKYEINCGDIYSKGEIKVIDNREIEVETQKIYKVKGDTIDAKEFIVNANSNYTYELVNKEEIEGYLNNNAGNYVAKIKVTSGTKVKEVEETLVILEHKIIGYLTCKSKEQNVSNSSTKKTVSNKFALVNDGNIGFGNIAYEIYQFKFYDETEYSNYLAQYKTNNTITIDNVTGDIEFNNDDLTINITNELSENDLNTKFNNDILTNYNSIKKYFIDTLGYECTFKKETQN